MAQSLSKVILHAVFSTKNREKTIPAHLRASLHAYLAGVCRARGSEAYRVGGTEDHVHIACTLPRTLTMAKLLEEIKKSSSIWMKQQEQGIGHFAWQAGYGIFSVGQSQLPGLLQYIDNPLFNKIQQAGFFEPGQRACRRQRSSPGRTSSNENL